MSMEITGNYSHYRENYVQSGKEEQTKKASGAESGQEAGKASDVVFIRKDEYVNSRESGEKPGGLYRLGQDEDGKPRILFDDPKKSGVSGGDGKPKVKDDSQKNSVEECTTDTGQVDREIRKLKEEKEKLERQMKTAAKDDEKTRDLEKKLAQVESELRQKDNDTYRRQNAVVS